MSSHNVQVFLPLSSPKSVIPRVFILFLQTNNLCTFQFMLTRDALIWPQFVSTLQMLRALTNGVSFVKRIVMAMFANRRNQL